MTQIESVPTNWTRDSRNIVQRNFDKLARRDFEVMRDVLNADPSELDTKLNGLMRTNEMDVRNLDNFGINFTADINAVIHRAWVYADGTGKVGFGLAEQERDGIVTAELYSEERQVNKGWNHVILNFPIEQGMTYTLFKRNTAGTIRMQTKTIPNWSQHDFVSNGMTFNTGKFLTSSGTYTNYSGFYEIELVTSLAQIYKIVNDSVKPERQFYVGNTPGPSDKFWFKPVGG